MTKSPPLITIAVCAGSPSAVLGTAIETILSQAGEGAELIFTKYGDVAGSDQIVESPATRTQGVVVRTLAAACLTDAWNDILVRATGQYVLFLGEQCVPAADWLAAYLRLVKRTPSDLLVLAGGPIRTICSRKPAWLPAELVEIDESGSVRKLTRGMPGALNFIVDRVRALKLGAFSIPEDKEDHPSNALCNFCARVNQMGFEQWWVPGAAVQRHERLITLSTLWRESIDNGARLESLRESQLSRRNRRDWLSRSFVVAPLIIAGLLLSAVFLLPIRRGQLSTRRLLKAGLIIGALNERLRRLRFLRQPKAGSILEQTIPPEVKDDEFYRLLKGLAKNQPLRNVLEIGSSSGAGSTQALVEGLRANPWQPSFFCMELSKHRFRELRRRYRRDDFVNCYNASSVPSDAFLTEKEVSHFYSTSQTKLNSYPLEEVLRWRRLELDYLSAQRVPSAGIELIKLTKRIQTFDLVLIDGSAFTGEAELQAVYGAAYILLDDVNDIKNLRNYERLKLDSSYTLCAENWNVRNGFACFKKIVRNDFASVEKQIKAIEGFMVEGQEEFLFKKVVSLSEDATILEIGSFKGRSTVTMAFACRNTRRRLFCIDTWNGNDSDFSERDFFHVWEENVRKNGVSEFVTPLRGLSHDVLARWNELTGNLKVDFAFIDGSHQYEDVLRDFELVLPLVKEGGWIAFHDVVESWPGPLKLWREIAGPALGKHQYMATLACGQKPQADGSCA
jgi:predicted O-methyltransferase YrrM